MSHRRPVVALVALAVLVPFAPRALAIWVLPEAAPVERLVKNLSARVREKPRDAHGHYLLGRVHGLAFALGTGGVGVQTHAEHEGEPWGEGTQRAWFAPSNPDSFNGRRGQRILEFDEAPGTPAEQRAHLRAGVRSLRDARRLDGDSGTYALGLAYLLEAGAERAAEVSTVEVLGLARRDHDEEAAARANAWIHSLGSQAAAQARALALEGLHGELEAMLPWIDDQRMAMDRARAEALAELLGRYWLERALGEYEHAYRKGIAADLAEEHAPFQPDWLGAWQDRLGWEGATGWLRVLDRLTTGASPVRAATAEEVRLRQKVEADVRTLEAKPDTGLITPIVMDLGTPAPLAELLDPSRVVCFDLDGDREVEPWPWVRPTTGILCWDPDGEGRITSGRQLFGNASWWLLFRDGYGALDALDDDRDGVLVGEELAGLALWFDRDGDGASGPGEVHPVGELGIVGLATRASGREGIAPMAERGVFLFDGTTRATYDWTTRPAPSP